MWGIHKGGGDVGITVAALRGEVVRTMAMQINDFLLQLLPVM